MGQPKKLTYKEKQDRKLAQDISKYEIELKKIHRGMQKSNDIATWRWAAMEIFKEVSNKFDNKSEKVKALKEQALFVAREAQTFSL
jgi:hypothetical protein